MKSNPYHQPCTAVHPAVGRGPLALCRKAVAQIERLRDAILSEFRVGVEPQSHLSRLVLNEAEALAWQTGYPHLFFPTLAEEKLRAMAEWSKRQWSLRRGDVSLAEAA